LASPTSLAWQYTGAALGFGQLSRRSQHGVTVSQIPGVDLYVPVVISDRYPIDRLALDEVDDFGGLRKLG
jgi:hypothetical protein